MLKFELNIADRKTLANRMEELTGIHPYYTRAPLYAYDIGNYTIDRDGNLLVEPENADAELLTTLLNEGLIRGGESIESTDDQPENTEPTENLADEPVAEEEPDDTAEDGATEDEPDAEESESEEQPEAEDQPEEVPLDLELAFPTSQHNGVSLRNLVNLIYSRGRLISKATGGHFHVETDLVETLRDDSCTYTVANFIEALKGYEAQCGTAMEGLVITEEKVSFTGFPTASDYDHLTAFGHLAILMNISIMLHLRQTLGRDPDGKRLDLTAPHRSDLPGQKPAQWKTPGAIKEAAEGQLFILHQRPPFPARRSPLPRTSASDCHG